MLNALDNAALQAARPDFLVIGGGSAGCAVARRLSDDPANKVLLLEAGGANRSWKVKLPGAALALLTDPRFEWQYRSEPDASRDGRVDLAYRGKGLGGSSAINGMIYVKGAPEDFDRWAAAGNDGWGWADVAPIYREIESAGEKPDRGRHGPLHTCTVGRPHRLTRSFLSATAAAGYRSLDDYNAGDQDGFARIELTQKRGFRFSAADAFLWPVRSRQNLEIATNCEAAALITEAGRAVGVRAWRDGELLEIRAAKVILAAGAFNSPKLLMLSGIGDGAELQAMGVEVRANIPGVGRNLREHPLVRLVYRSRIATFNDWKHPHHALRHAFNFAAHGEGPLKGVFEAIGFFRSDPSLARPDLQVHFMPMALPLNASGRLETSTLSGVSVYVNISHPRSTGRVRLASPSFRDAPLIEPNMMGDPGDVRAMVQGLARMQAVMREPVIASLLEEEVIPGFAAAGKAAEAYARANAEPSYHPVGTCAMGNGPDAVVDARLACRGVQGLWIADASIMPDLPSGNTNAPSILIGDRAGRWLQQNE